MQRFVVIVFFLGSGAATGGENLPILRDMAERLGNGVLATAYRPVPAVAIYEAEWLCLMECQEFRQEFRGYLVVSGRLPSPAGRKTLRWEWHVGQGLRKNAGAFFILAYDHQTMQAWWARLKVNEDHEEFFAAAVRLMEESRVGEQFHVFQLDPSPD